MKKEQKDTENDAIEQLKRNVEYYTSQCARCRANILEQESYFERMENERDRWEAALKAAMLVPAEREGKDGL